MGPNHIMETNLIFTKSVDLNVNLILKNTLTETAKIVFDQISGYHGLTKLTRKINDHTLLSSFFIKSCLTSSTSQHIEKRIRLILGNLKLILEMCINFYALIIGLLHQHGLISTTRNRMCTVLMGNDIFSVLYDHSLVSVSLLLDESPHGVAG